MKVAIIADVHGNLPALEAVLEDIEARRVDQVLVNGDLVNRGPSNVEVVRWFLDSGAEGTLGNHDDLLRMWVDHDAALADEWYADPFWASTGWSARRLRDAGLVGALRALPMTLRVDLEKAPSLLLAHGSPRHYREGYGKHLSDADISDITKTHPADVLIGSHTHEPLWRRWGRTLVLNTGSVGNPFDGDLRAQYLLLELEGGVWVPQFRRVPYDHALALERFDASGLRDAGGLSGEVFYQELLHGRSYLTPFLMWVEAHGGTRDRAAWEAFRREHPQRFAAPGPMTAAETIAPPVLGPEAAPEVEPRAEPTAEATAVPTAPPPSEPTAEPDGGPTARPSAGRSTPGGVDATDPTNALVAAPAERHGR